MSSPCAGVGGWIGSRQEFLTDWAAWGIPGELYSLVWESKDLIALNQVRALWHGISHHLPREVAFDMSPQRRRGHRISLSAEWWWWWWWWGGGGGALNLKVTKPDFCMYLQGGTAASLIPPQRGPGTFLAFAVRDA